MKLQDYAKIINAVDQVRNIVGEEVSELLISTMEKTYDKVEEFCKNNVSGFSQNGVLVPIIKEEDEGLTFEIDLRINGKSVEDENYAAEIAKIMEDAYLEIGWEMNLDED